MVRGPIEIVRIIIIIQKVSKLGRELESGENLRIVEYLKKKRGKMAQQRHLERSP